MIPSCNRKVICGWSNYSGKEISHKICENRMDNRGSKSVILPSWVLIPSSFSTSWRGVRGLGGAMNITVKEQRVYGS